MTQEVYEEEADGGVEGVCRLSGQASAFEAERSRYEAAIAHARGSYRTLWVTLETVPGVSGIAPVVATAQRLDRKCGLGVSFDPMIGRLALGHETAASVLAAFLLERYP